MVSEPLATPSSVLGYAKRPRRSRWWIVLIILTVLIGAAGWYRGELRRFLVEHYAIVQMYRAQTSCETASASDGEIVVRTDGQTDGITDTFRLPQVPALPIQISKPVVRRPKAYDDFCTTTSQPRVSGPFSVPMPFRRLSSTAALIDCSRRKTPSGNAVLAWVTIEASGSSIRVVTSTTIPGTMTRRPSEVLLASPYPDPGQIELDFDEMTGPATVRRIAADHPLDVRCRVEQGNQNTVVTAEWSGDRYVVKLGTPSAVIKNSNSGQLRIWPSARSLPVVSGEFVGMLPGDLRAPRAMAADAKGVVILSDCMTGQDGWQVHRFDWIGHRVTELVPADKALDWSVLSTDGSRVTSRRTGEVVNGSYPVALTVYDLLNRTRRAIDPTIVADNDARNVDVADDGIHLVVNKLREPILVFDRNLLIAERVQSERADWLMPNGRYMVRINSDAIDVYDFQNRTWTPPIEGRGSSKAYLSPDGRLICRGDPWWSVLDTATGNVVATLKDQPYSPDNAVFSPDGKWLALGGIYAYLIDFRDPSAPCAMQIATPKAYPKTFVAFSPDSKQLMLLRETTLSCVALDDIGREGRTK